jgi:hypothetical protein
MPALRGSVLISFHLHRRFLFVHRQSRTSQETTNRIREMRRALNSIELPGD